MLDRSGSGPPPRPGYIRPPGDVNLPEIAGRVVREVMPTLRQAQVFRSFGALASAQALGGGTLDGAALVKDLGSAGGTIHDIARAGGRVAGQRMGGEARALAGAAAHAKVAGQIGFDLVRARVAVSQAEEAVRAFRSPAAESALVFMRPELRRLRSAFEGERASQRSYQQIADGLADKLGSASSRLGKAALAAEAASRSVVGRTIMATGRMLAHPWIGWSLVALGVGVASIKGGREAPTDAAPWKAAYGAAAGAAAGLVDIRLPLVVGRTSPALLYDPAVKYGAQALGLGEAGDKLTIGRFYDEISRSIVSLTQAATTGDAEPLNAVHRRSMEGNGHAVLQGYSMIGEALSRTALVDAALTRTAEWRAGVPDEFKTSPSWWSALRSDAAGLLEAGQGAAITVGEALGLGE